MNKIDRARRNLVDEIIVISKRLRWSAEYIESVPRMDRVHALKIIEKMVQEEEKQVQEMKQKTASMKSKSGK